LRASGLLASRKDGLHVRYRVADPSVIDGYRALRSLAESRISEVQQLATAFFGDTDGAEPIGIEELMARSERGEVLLVDVRPVLEFDAGHLPGAVNIPLEQLSARLAEFDAGTEVVAYCRGPYCVLAAQAVSALRDAGRPATRLAAGPIEWQAAGLSLTSGT
jgi:rhodanese-related sulfurtransferase